MANYLLGNKEGIAEEDSHIARVLRLDGCPESVDLSVNGAFRGRQDPEDGTFEWYITLETMQKVEGGLGLGGGGAGGGAKRRHGRRGAVLADPSSLTSGMGGNASSVCVLSNGGAVLSICVSHDLKDIDHLPDIYSAQGICC